MTTLYRLIYSFFLVFFMALNIKAEPANIGTISGQLQFDKSWDTTIYLSYIPTLEERNRMSADMIIGSAQIDKDGHFLFDISFLPPENNLFRLHMVKHDDSPYSLIIGGKDENHMFLIANGSSVIHIQNDSKASLFEEVTFSHSDENLLLNRINDIKHSYDSTQMVKSISKRQFMEEALDSELRLIADTCPDALVGLYAIYSSHFEENYATHKHYYKHLLKKWRKQDSPYFEAFREKAAINKSPFALSITLLTLSLIVLAYFFFRKRQATTPSLINQLSVQERKVFSYLQEGLSNQQISDECNIGISTVKTHVSNVYAKLGIKSRKEALNFEA